MTELLNDTSSNNRSALPSWLLLLTVFTTGASILVIELIGTRVLAPFFGSGIYTWSALITVTLAALALGYATGGKLIDKFTNATLLFHLCFIAGIWTALTSLMATALLPSLLQFDDVRIGIVTASLMLFSPNLFVLGMASPFVIRLFSQDHETSGTTSGRVFSISTIGSLIGAVATGFFLVPQFSVLQILTFCSFALLVLAALGYLYLNRYIDAVASLAIAVLFTISFTSPATQTSSLQIIDSSPSFYGHVQVVQKKDYKVLLVDGVGQNYHSSSTGKSLNYINFLSAVTNLQRIENKKSLVIGLGAGQLSTLLKNSGSEVTSIEIDPVIDHMARKHFDFSLPEDSVLFTDGRLFLNQTEEKYHHIIIDAFNADQIAWHLLTRQALQAAKLRLKNAGMLAINITSIAPGKDVASIYRTLASVFEHVRVFNENPETKLTNIVFIASGSPVQLNTSKTDLSFTQRININQYLAGEIRTFKNGIILTDEYNPVAYYHEQAQQQWRKQMREFLGDEYYQLAFL